MVELLKGAEAKAILRISDDTLRRMIRQGHLQGFITGKTTRVTRESLDQLIGRRPGKKSATKDSASRAGRP